MVHGNLSLWTVISTVLLVVVPHALLILKSAAEAARGGRDRDPLASAYSACAGVCLGSSPSASPLTNVLQCLTRLPYAWAHLLHSSFRRGASAGPEFELALLAATAPAVYVFGLLMVALASPKSQRAIVAVHVHTAFAVGMALLVPSPWSFILQRLWNRPCVKPSIAFDVLHSTPNSWMANPPGVVLVLFPFFGHLRGRSAAVFWLALVAGQATYVTASFFEAKHYLVTAPQLLAGNVSSSEDLPLFLLQQLMLATVSLMSCVACNRLACQLHKPKAPPAPPQLQAPAPQLLDRSARSAQDASAPSGSAPAGPALKDTLTRAASGTGGAGAAEHPAARQGHAPEGSFELVLAGISVSVLQGKVHLCLPDMDPQDLPEDWQERLQQRLRARYPKLRLRSAAVWKGSLHMVLECCGAWDEEDAMDGAAAALLEEGLKLVAQAALEAASARGPSTAGLKGEGIPQPKTATMALEVGKAPSVEFCWSLQQQAWAPTLQPPAVAPDVGANPATEPAVVKNCPPLLLPISPRVFTLDSLHLARALSSRRRRTQEGSATCSVEDTSSRACLGLQLLCRQDAASMRGLTCVVRWDGAGAADSGDSVCVGHGRSGMGVQVFKDLRALVQSMGPPSLQPDTQAPLASAMEVVLELPLDPSLAPACAALLTVELYGPASSTLPLATTTLLHLPLEVMAQLAELAAAGNARQPDIAVPDSPGALKQPLLGQLPSFREAAANGAGECAWLDALTGVIDALDSRLLRLAGQGATEAISTAALHASELAKGVGKALQAISCWQHVHMPRSDACQAGERRGQIATADGATDVALWQALVAEGLGQCLRYGAWEAAQFLLEAVEQCAEDEVACSTTKQCAGGEADKVLPAACGAHGSPVQAAGAGVRAVLRLLGTRVEVLQEGQGTKAARNSPALCVSGGLAHPAVVLPLALLPVKFGHHAMVLSLEAWLEARGSSFPWTHTYHLRPVHIKGCSPLSLAWQCGQGAWAVRAAAASWLRWPAAESGAGRVDAMRAIRRMDERLVHVRCHFAVIMSVVCMLYAARELCAGDLRTLASFVFWPAFYYLQAWMSLRYGAAGKAWLVHHSPGLHLLAAIHRCACMVAAWPLRLLTPVDSQALGRFYCDLRYTPAEIILEPLLNHALEPVPPAVTPWLLLGDVLGRTCMHMGFRVLAQEGGGAATVYPLATCVARSLVVSAAAAIFRWAAHVIARRGMRLSVSRGSRGSTPSAAAVPAAADVHRHGALGQGEAADGHHRKTQ